MRGICQIFVYLLSDAFTEVPNCTPVMESLFTVLKVGHNSSCKKMPPFDWLGTRCAPNSLRTGAVAALVRLPGSCLGLTHPAAKVLSPRFGVCVTPPCCHAPGAELHGFIPLLHRSRIWSVCWENHCIHWEKSRKERALVQKKKKQNLVGSRFPVAFPLFCQICYMTISSAAKQTLRRLRV